MNEKMKEQVALAAETPKKGGVILYPADTVWKKSNISLAKGRSIFIVDLFMIPVFVLVIFSGLKLHEAGHMNDHDIWEYWAHYHIIVSILSLILGGLHIRAHWGWYKSLIKKGIVKKSRITIFISVLFFMEVITGIILISFIEGGNSSVGLWHYGLGLVMAVMIIIHIVYRFRLMINGLRRIKSK